MPPQKDDHTPIPSAKPGSPFLAMGKPSKVVATDDGVPGMPVNIPAIRPPDRPPTRTLTMVASPKCADIPKVNVKVSTTAMAMVKPGIAPAINPAATPTAINNKAWPLASTSMAARILSTTTTCPLNRIHEDTRRQHHAKAEGEQTPHETNGQHGDVGVSQRLFTVPAPEDAHQHINKEYSVNQHA